MDRLATISSLSFDRYIELCIDKDLLKTLSTLLNISSANVRSFMTSYVFKYFLSEIMDPLIRSEEDIEMIKKAETLIDSIQKEGFSELLYEYKRAFIEWKEFDRPRTASPFINKYKTLRNIRDIDDKHYYKRELKLLIDMTFLQLITMINSIGGEDALARIDSDPDPLVVDESLKEEFISLSKETFWSMFREELPNYDKVIILLRDFAERYRLVVPNRVDLLEELSEIIDTEFIYQRLNDRSHFINVNSLLPYMDYIVVKTKSVDVPDKDNETDRWFSDLKESPLSISDPIYLLRNFFDYIFDRLDNVLSLSKELTPAIREMYSVQKESSYNQIE